MSEKAIKKAGEIIKSKTAAENMGAGVTLSLIDSEGYPTTSTISIAKADGIRRLTFVTGLDSNKAKRIKECSRASVCIFCDDYEKTGGYNITLVGTIEILTDPETKKEMWYDGLAEHFNGPTDPQCCVLSFTTHRYNLFVDEEEVTGTFSQSESTCSPNKNATPSIELLLAFNRQCEEAIELYKKAFGAELTYLGRYSEADPQDRPPVYDAEKDANMIFHAQMKLGSQNILLCDNLDDSLPGGGMTHPVALFKTTDEVKAAYEILADGATNITPPTKTTYCKCCASLTDKFGVYWDLMTDN